MTVNELIEQLEKVQFKDARVMVASGTLAIDAHYVSELIPENAVLIF